MALTPFSYDVQVIHKLGDRPIVDNNLTVQQFKDKFDEASVNIKSYINGTLIPEIEAGLAEKEIFWATYGETTYSEVKAAYDANYLVLCEYNANIYLLTYWMGLNGPYFTFTAVTEENDGNYLKYLKLRGSGWSNGSIQIPHAEDVPTKTSDLTNDSGFITAEDVPEEIIEISGALNGTTITVASLGGKTVQDLVNAKEVILHTGDGTGMFCLHRANVVYYAVDLYILIFSGIVRGMLSTTDHMMTAVFSMVQGSATSMTGTFSDNSASIPSAATASPLMDGTAAVGSSSKYAKEDHVHPSDTSKITMPDGGSVGQVLKKTANGTEWADESGGGGAEVFWAEYGTTTYSEIGAALTAGKLVLCEYGGIYYSYHYRMIDTRYFTSEGGYWITVTSGNVWAQGQVLPPSAATDPPLMDGTAAVGSSARYAREDHVHPSDTGKADKVSVVSVADAGAVTQALDANKVFDFTGALTSLTITLNAAAAPAQYHFCFQSGSTAPTLTLPNTVVMPRGFQVEANKHYEIDILDGYGAAQSW